MDSQRFQPTTFHDRGVFVPFTTPALQMARARPGERGSLDLLVPSFANNGTIYVLPWHSLHDFISVSMHDRLLHAEIGRLRLPTPLEVSNAAHRVAASGIGGEALAEASQARLRADTRLRVEIQTILLLAFLAESGVAGSELAGSTDLAALRAKTARHASRVGLALADVDAAFARIAEALVPLGIPGQANGRLALVMTDMQRFARELEAAAADLDAVGQGVCDTCATVIWHNLALARPLVDAVLAMAFDFASLGHGPDALGARVVAGVTRLAWLLDGWDLAIQEWDSRSSDQQAVTKLTDRIPWLPLEADPPKGKVEQKMSRIFTVTRGYSRELEDWRTGTVDRDIMKRIERIRADAVSRMAEAR